METAARHETESKSSGLYLCCRHLVARVALTLPGGKHVGEGDFVAAVAKLEEVVQCLVCQGRLAMA